MLPTYELTGEKVTLSFGIVYFARLTRGCLTSELDSLRDTTFEVDEKVFTIAGIEKFMTVHQSEGMGIGLLIKE